MVARSFDDNLNPAVAIADEEMPTSSGVSWSAIIGGGVAALAVTLILMMLGAGIGFSVVSPWYGVGASATAVGVGAIVWLVLTQWIASAVGGYLAGRLRTKWIGVHTHEVFFRDTAHGFLAWGAASIIGAALFAASAASGVSAVAKGMSSVAAAGVAGAAASAGGQTNTGNEPSGPLGYYVDTLFRSPTPSATPAPSNGTQPNEVAEAGRILAKGMADGQLTLSPDDKTYLVRLVASRTGLSQQDAEQRVDTTVNQVNETLTKARQAADEARKRAAQLSIVTALAMVIGAFIASVSGALGGRLRIESELRG